jgi:hypothetical protein
MDAPKLAQTIPLGSQQWPHCASQVIDLIWVAPHNLNLVNL